MVNYGIRYPFREDNEMYNSANNYRAWSPNIKIEDFIIYDEKIGDKGQHNHEFIPKDYVPKVK